MKYSLIFTLLFLFILFPKDSFSEADSLREIDISSEQFEMRLNEKIMLFRKNVKIKYHKLESKCDLAQIKLYGNNSKVQEIIMSGNVFIYKDNTEIRGNKVIFEPETQNLKVEGEVKTRILFNKNQ